MTSLSSFRIWNSSTGISSPPLALFIVMFPKAHLTSHSRMSGCRWVITPSWLSGSWRSFFVSFSYLFLPTLLNIFCYVHTISVLYWAHLCMKCSLGNFNFLEELSRVFPILLFSSISLHWELRKAFLSLLAIFGALHSNRNIFPFLLCFSLLFFSQL